MFFRVHKTDRKSDKIKKTEARQINFTLRRKPLVSAEKTELQ